MLPLKKILDAIPRAKIAVYGDFCLDAYWTLDPKGSEISIETGLPAQSVARQSYSLGGAGNIVANLAALRPAGIQVVGVIGDDLFGRELRRLLDLPGVDTAWLVVQQKNFNTVTYCKRYLDGEEQPRIDFGFTNRRSRKTEQKLLAGLREAFETADAIIFNQQVPGSLRHASFIRAVNRLLEAFPEKIVLLDSRHYGAKFTHVYRKTNEVEAARLNGERVARGEPCRLADLRRYARNLFAQSGRPVFITRGSRGMIVCDAGGLHEIPGIHLTGKLDPVGAGDTTVSALACCLAAGYSAVEAAMFANYAAAVTVQKPFQTGTASPQEILLLAEEADFVYQPELAADSRKARYFENSEIELCCDLEKLDRGRIRHAVFDHDGTISTLREGWQVVMQEMMLRAILGEQHTSVDEAIYRKARQRVQAYIAESTGLQTILQMEALVEMVREFGLVPEKKILDKFGYKGIYNAALMQNVNARMRKMQAGELAPVDVTIKGAVSFLQALSDLGVRLYLASGTDQADVEAEAHALGYASLFRGGIYGAVGDIRKYSKKLVLEKIMHEHGLSGVELAVFGDGPVEMRACRKYGGIAVGMATDEVRRHGLNPEKRTRLISAGAQFIVPDFSQGETLLRCLFPN